MEGIEEEQDRRDINSVNLLNRALKNAEVIQRELESGGLERKKQALLAQSYQVNDEESKRMREEILQELKGKINKDKKELAYNTNLLIQQYNEERIRLLEKEEDLLVQKAIHQGIQNRG